ARPARATAAAKPARSAAPKSEARPARASAAAKPARATAARPATRSAPAIRQIAASKASASKAAAAQAKPPARKGATVNPAAGKPVAKPAKSASKTEKPAATRQPRKVPQRAKLDPSQIELLVKATVASLEDDKAEDVVVLDIASRSAFADRMVVATGLADRQIQAMAAHLDKVLAEHGIRRIRTETSPDWVLLDAGDLIVHLFKPEARANYRLEKMWGPDSPPPGEEDSLAGDDAPLPSLTAADYADDEDDLDGDALDGGMDEDDGDGEGRG
ncbi:ribosome silencing factor, partial [Pseudoroseomonas deserti]